ncbi:MAG: hypothetical protein WA738_15190 [Candidatus Angelobacter sp.]
MTTELRRKRKPFVWLVILVLCALAQPLALADKKKPEKAYALIFGTAYGPDDRPLYGVRITIHPQGKKSGNWTLVSDHRGEFAQRVHPGPADYLISGEAEYAPLGDDGKPQMSRKKRLKGETKVHIDGEERQDIGLHLTE